MPRPETAPTRTTDPAVASPRARRRLRLALLLGLMCVTAYAALLETALLAEHRFENCPAYEDEGPSAALASDQAWWCADGSGGWDPDIVVALGALVVAVVLAVVLWRRFGLRGWVAGLVVLLVFPLLGHLALQLPGDECDAAQLRAQSPGRCTTDRELMRE